MILPKVTLIYMKKSYTYLKLSIIALSICAQFSLKAAALPPPPTLTISANNICAGQTVTFTASGGTIYDFNVNGLSVQNGTLATYVTNTLVNGDVVYVISSASNSSTITMLVNANPILTISPSSQSVCVGKTATLTASGASSYTWSSGSNASSIVTSPVIATTYSVIGANAGCTGTAFQTIGISPSPTVNITSSTPSVCAGFNALLIASGLNTYTWSTGATGAVLSVNPLVPSTYSVAATDMAGCTAVGNISIGILNPAFLTISASSSVSCGGGPVTLTASGALTYTWNNSSNNTSIIVNPTANTTYSVVANIGSGCISNASYTVVLGSYPTINLGADVTVNNGDNYQFNPTQTGANTYTWSPNTYLNNPNIINPTSTPQNDITYVLTVTSALGCSSSDTINVTVLKDFFIANFMTPNGDGLNDTWKVSVPSNIKDFSVEIIDSYGQTVYSKADNYNNEFDGKKGGQDLPDGVYYYFIKEGSSLKYKGNITLTK
jgi:gliding motility-associated-like protein